MNKTYRIKPLAMDWRDDRGRLIADNILGRFVIEPDNAAPEKDAVRWYKIGGGPITPSPSTEDAKGEVATFSLDTIKQALEVV